MKQKDGCGCVSDGTHWLVQCPTHAAETVEYHAAMMEHRSVQPPRRDLGNAEGLV